MNDRVNGKAIKRWFKEQNNTKPKKVKGQIAIRTQYYRRELERLAKSLFKIDIPDNWDYDYVLDTLISWGYIIICDSDIGVIACRGSLTGLNYLSLPTTAVISLPILGDFERTIGKDAEVIYVERKWPNMYYKFLDTINYYAEKLASADCCIDVNLMNSRLGYIAEAETKAQSDTIKEAFDRITEGEPLVVYRKDAMTQQGLQVFFNAVKQNFIAGDVQDVKRTIINELLTSWGINNANTDKKERLITSEVAANNEELLAETSVWKNNLERQLRKTKKIFPDLQFNIELQFTEESRRITENIVGGNQDGTTGRNRTVGSDE